MAVAEPMSIEGHATMINGVWHKIIGGTTLVDGTRYDITSGRVLVNGTGYDIPFLIPVTVVGGKSSASAGSGQGLGYAEYNGAKYTDETIYMQPGEQVRIHLQASMNMLYSKLVLTVYGETIAGTKVGSLAKEYYLTVTKASKIEFADKGTYFTATVTEA